MKLNLKNPLVFLDLETTGINVVTDRIVEIALLKVYPDGREEEKLLRINPGMPIEWSPIMDKVPLKEYFVNYFASRKEDGIAI